MISKVFSGHRLYRPLVVVAAAAVLAACSLPEPDGTEALLIETAQGRAGVTPSQGTGPKAVARNGLLISPEVRAAASRVSASADEVRVERAARFPSLNISLGAGVGDGGLDENSVDLRARQLLLDFGATDRAITSADIQLQIDYLSFLEEVDASLQEVLETYDLVRRNLRLLRIREAQLEAMQSLQELVQVRTESGAAPRSDLLEIQKRVQTAQLLVTDARLELGESRDRLTRLSGQAQGGGVAGISAGSCRAPKKSKALQKAQLELAQAEVELTQAEKARKPRAYIEPVARQSLDGEGVRVGVNLGVDSDLLQGGALTARVNAARNNQESAAALVAATQREPAIDENRLKREIAAARSRTATLQRQIALLEETRQLYRSQYFDLGARRISELLENEEEFYSRQAEVVELQAETTVKVIDCAIRAEKLTRQLGLAKLTLFDLPLSVNQPR